MAVINLPRDTRWGELGNALGALGGQVAQNFYERYVNQGVQEVQNDPNTAENQKLPTIAARFGNAGVVALTNQLKANLLNAQTAGAAADTGFVKAKTASAVFDLGKSKDFAPAELAKLKADIAAQDARTQLTTAETAKVPVEIENIKQAIQDRKVKGPAEVEHIQAQTAAAQAGIPLVQARERLTDVEAGKTIAETGNIVKQGELLDQQKVMREELAKPGALEATLKGQGITDPRDLDYVRAAMAADPKNGLRASIAKINEVRMAREKPQMLPTVTQQKVTAVAGQLENLAPFLEPVPPGTPTGFLAGVKQMLNKKGFGEDGPLMTRATAAEQSMANFASTGTGLGGAYRVPLAKNVTPQINHTAMYNVLEVGQLARITIAELNAEKELAAKQPGMDISPIQHQIDAYQKLLDRSNQFWWTSPEQTEDSKVHFFYGGQEVDPSHLRPMGGAKELPANQRYELPDGTTARGGQINAEARRIGQLPEKLLNTLQKPRR